MRRRGDAAPPSQRWPKRTIRRGLQSGFTLVELIVVMSLIGIVAAVGAVRLFDKPALQARTFSQALAQTLAAAQRLAVAQRQSVHVVIEADPARVSLCRDAGCTQTIAPAPGSSSTLTADDGLQLQAATTTLFFDGLGRPSTSAVLTLTVLLSDGSSSGRGVLLQPDTGHVQTF